MDQASFNGVGGRPATVLVVDDEPDILLTLAFALEHRIPGVRVLVAASAQEALRFLAEEPIDLVVTDYRMPGMSGLDLLRRIRDTAPTVVTMMMTAYPEDRLVIDALNDAHVRQFLTKPFGIMDLVEAVTLALRERAEEASQRALLARHIAAAARRAPGLADLAAQQTVPLTPPRTE